jgi:hypothetical protein
MQSFADNIVELAVKALEIRGHGDITKVVEDAEDEGLYDGIEVVKYDDNRVVVGGWIDFQFSEVRNVIVVSLYGPGHRGELTLTETKDFGVGEPSFAVAWAIGKMLEAELIEEL